MDYRAHYDRLMDRARRRTLDGYVERHHVIPKCIGGSDTRENIVALTPEEHFVAHQLLVKMYPGNHRLLWAASAMTGHNGSQARNNRMYAWLRRRFSEMVGAQSRGRKATPESRQKMSAAKQGKKRGPYRRDPNKSPSPLKGRPKSDAHRAALAAAKLGKSYGPRPPEVREKIRQGNIKAATKRDYAETQGAQYREQQRQSMLRVWAERRRANHKE